MGGGGGEGVRGLEMGPSHTRDFTFVALGIFGQRKIQTEKERVKKGERERQTDRQTERDRDRQTETDRDRQREKERERERGGMERERER